MNTNPVTIKTLEMDNIQHEAEQESDDDCEVYFLKPVNEYNIVDKIKEANKELFSDELGTDFEVMAESQQSRKVSFAANLEEYEPQNGINFKELETKLGIDCIDYNEKNLLKTEKEQKLEIITEEEILNHEMNVNPQDTEDEQKGEPHIFPKTKEDNEDKPDLNQTKLCDNEEENVMLEEICEEILIMDMESEKAEVLNPKKSESPLIQRKMHKQITFDFTEDDEETDNKSLTNLLISDSENDSCDDEDENQEYNYNESLTNDTDSEGKELLINTDYYNDDEEDDKLSIIVASYLPDDMACDRNFLNSFTNKNSSPRPSKSRKLPFNKRFSFRRKSKSSNAIGSCSNHHVSNSGCFLPPPEVTDLKLHYKTCCEFKNGQQKLPKYTGYISEYGLSNEQLLERQCKLQQREHIKAIKTLKTSETEVRKMHDNEMAFTTWLRNKMRFPINKTRNMFDVKRPFGLRKCTSLGGNSLSDDTRQMLNITKHRSISAKLKKV